MIKQISFQKEFIPLIKTGIKTVTRRLKTNLETGDVAYFKAGRLGRKEGYIKILKITSENLQDLWQERDYFAMREELQKEGMSFVGREVREGLFGFKNLWDKLNRKKYRWENNPKVYRIKFEYMGKEIR